MFDAYPFFLGSKQIDSLFTSYDLVVDATDNFLSRSLIAETCQRLGLPQIYGAIFRAEGQVTVFNCGEPQGALADLFAVRSEEHTSELQSLMRISSAVFCLN